MNKIKSFKEFINESAWGDMMRRGSGEEIRTEDDVNLLDVDELTAYLRKNYRIDDPLTIARLIGNGGCIYVSLYEDTDGYDYILMYEHIDNGDKKLYLSGGVKEVSEDIFNEMKNKYKVTVLNDYDPDGHPLGNIMVKPNDGRNITNKFFIELLDFIIERIEKPLTQKIYKKSMNESAWGDMMRRGSGEDIRKEDDVNILDLDGFYDYLNKTYVTVPNNLEPAGTLLLKINILDNMSMLVLTDLNGIYRLRLDNFSDKDKFISFPLTPNLKKNQLYHRLKDNYLIKEIETIEHGSEIHIYPRNGEVNNSFYVELIDFILENTGSSLTKNIKRK